MTSGATARHRFQYGSHEVACDVRWGKRKSLRISVHPDQTVRVDAPVGRTLEEVAERIERKAAWIVRQQFYFEQFMPRQPEKRYVAGETFRYLGRQVRLKVSIGKPQAVRMNGVHLWVTSLHPDDQKRTRKLVEGWYRTRSREIFSKRLAVCMAIAGRHGITEPTIQLRRMTRRWGSCRGRESILLNTELLKAPVYCIDYVIMHELCHLRHTKHNDPFYRLLDVLMPDWERRKNRLERVQ